MSAIHDEEYQYQIGGSLPESASTYVKRQADTDFYQGLKDRKYCYVLNSRQMGKSSLRVRIMAIMKREGFVCGAIEMRELCTQDVTQEQFYAGFISLLVSEFDLNFDAGDWWRKNNHISYSVRLSKFIEEELLENILQDIIIFVDEIDSILSLNFKDDFFAFVRSCCNKRADKPKKYNRLTFALLGVASPGDLIERKDRTPFNIASQAINLTGFQIHEVKPLEIGLITVVNNPQAVLKEILNWTGGQPFLTQWLCQTVQKYSSQIYAINERDLINKIVRLYIIDNCWQAQDNQQHFTTIRDRVVKARGSTQQRLKLYKKILQQGKIEANDSLEQIELRLSGLVVNQKGKLEVYNRLYNCVFDKKWIKKALAECSSEEGSNNQVAVSGMLQYLNSLPWNIKAAYLITFCIIGVSILGELVNFREIVFTDLPKSTTKSSPNPNSFPFSTAPSSSSLATGEPVVSVTPSPTSISTPSSTPQLIPRSTPSSTSIFTVSPRSTPSSISKTKRDSKNDSALKQAKLRLKKAQIEYNVSLNNIQSIESELNIIRTRFTDAYPSVSLQIERLEQARNFFLITQLNLKKAQAEVQRLENQ